MGEVERKIPEVSNEGLAAYPVYGKNVSGLDKAAVLAENKILNAGDTYNSMDAGGNLYLNGEKIDQKFYKHTYADSNYYGTLSDENCTNKVEGYSLINNIPYRFANVITNIVKDNKRVGVFLLNNGDIILSKNQQIKFVKRNMHWLNFNIKSFKNSIKSFVEKYNIESKIIDEIYSTALDVSFAHTGGIIALVTKDDIIDSLDKASIVNRCDYISSKDTDEKIEEYLIQKNDSLNDKRLDKDELDKDINKKMLKRAMIKKMLNNNFQFVEISRKLRSELVSLDGACIINSNGFVYSFGVIIQNDSGSTGGGRGAAAKKLLSNGMAIKISTDGYIEVYLEQRKIYVIK